MRNLNPNQFALPGMEHLAHPLAPYVAEGARFEFKTDRVPTHNEYDQPNDPERVGKPRTHTLEAFHGEKEVGALDWRGSHSKSKYGFPGEIKWVGRAEARTEDIYYDKEQGRWREQNPPPRHAGIMTAMFYASHEMNLGQSTVPVHSQDRSWQGEKWAQAVGDYGHGMPEVGDIDWRPPKGIHPFEQEAKAEKKAAKKARKALKKPKGQRKLF